MVEIIGIEKNVNTRDKFGSSNFTWQTAYDGVRAEVTSTNGYRSTSEDEIFFAHQVTFHIRYLSNVDERMRIKWDGKYYRILSIDYTRNRKEIKINTELINE